MTTTANKRSLEEANIDSSNPSKKRKLNEDEAIAKMMIKKMITQQN